MMISAKPPTRSRIDVVLMALIGIALVIFGFRQSIAGLTTLPGNATLLALQSLQPVSAEQIDRLIAEEKQALTLQETAERWSNLSTALAVRPTKEEDRL